MNIQEQIIALLNGDLQDHAQVEELMHVLAVSPEKRTLFVEQVRLSRTFATVGGSIAPSRQADDRIWQGIHAIDAGMAPAGGASSIATSAAASTTAATLGGLLRRFWRQGLAALILIAGGFGAGYLLRAPEPGGGPAVAGRATVAPQASSPMAEARSDRSAIEIVRLRDSLRLVTMEMGALRSDRDRITADLGHARRTISGLAATVRELPEVRMLKRADIPSADGPENRLAARGEGGAVASSTAPSGTAPAISSGSSIGGVQLREDRYLSPVPAVADRLPSSLGEPFPLAAAAGTSYEDEGSWRFGVNNIFRLSLPRVYGLPEKSTIATDRELDLSYRFREVIGSGALRVGAAAGQAPFGQIFYKSSDGSARVDTIIEQRPALFYGRGYVAPELFRSGIISGSLELGAGGTRIGPILTVGSNLEAASDASFGPFDGIATHIGISSWILWSQTGGRTYASTNLNVQIGAALRF